MPSKVVRKARARTTLLVTYRGGPECWWEIKTSLGTIRRPGHLSLHDVLSEVIET